VGARSVVSSQEYTYTVVRRRVWNYAECRSPAGLRNRLWSAEEPGADKPGVLNGPDVSTNVLISLPGPPDPPRPKLAAVLALIAQLVRARK